jgi:plasmid maintenance system antidote protein VapI
VGSHGRILIFADLPSPILDLGEPLARALHIARDTMERLTRAEVEVAVITALRERFGRVPEVHIVFEPVISLSCVSRH